MRWTFMRGIDLRASLVAVFAAAVVLIGGCATTSDRMAQNPEYALTDTLWKAAEIGGEAILVETPPHMTLDPDDRRVSGYGGVNNFGGSFATDGAQHLTFSHVFSTRRAGPPAQMAVEVALLQALEASRSYRIDGESLDLLDASGGVIARFTTEQQQ